MFLLVPKLAKCISIKSPAPHWLSEISAFRLIINYYLYKETDYGPCKVIHHFYSLLMRLGIKNSISKQSFLNHEIATENLFALKSDLRWCLS